MQINAYDKSYLEDVANKLGTMLEYAVSNKYDPNTFWDLLITSTVAREIENGNPKYLAGYSAFDYFNIVISTLPGNEQKTFDSDYKIQNDIYYWTGFVIAHLQFESNLSFFKINKYFPFNDVTQLYFPLHEADVKKFIDIALDRIKNSKEN